MHHVRRKTGGDIKMRELVEQTILGHAIDLGKRIMGFYSCNMLLLGFDISKDKSRFNSGGLRLIFGCHAESTNPA